MTVICMDPLHCAINGDSVSRESASTILIGQDNSDTGVREPTSEMCPSAQGLQRHRYAFVMFAHLLVVNQLK